MLAHILKLEPLVIVHLLRGQLSATITMASLPPEISLQILQGAIEDQSSSLERFELGPNDEYGRWRETKGYKDSLVRIFGMK